jgi:hypothetical protein
VPFGLPPNANCFYVWNFIIRTSTISMLYTNVMNSSILVLFSI